MHEIEQFDDTVAVLGESPIWSVEEQALYWVDTIGQAIFRRKFGDSKATKWSFDEEVGSIGFWRGGGLIVAFRSGFYFFDPGSGERTALVDPEPELARNRLNDGKVDRAGRFWSGSLQEGDYAPVGNLWSVDGGLCITKALDGLTIPNALCWSPDGSRMYFADSPSRQIDVFDFDTAAGTVANRRMFARIPEGKGLPDGATTDQAGRLWCANIDGGRVSCFRPDGSLEREIELPVSRPTSCAFGGPGLDILFVTTATKRLSTEQIDMQPWAGCVLAIKVDATGISEPQFSAPGLPD